VNFGELMSQDWHLDRRVPLALVLALVMQAVSALLWAGAASERIAALETQAATNQVLLERTARLEVETAYIRASLDRLERRLMAEDFRGGRP
jgi:hypothetical protein